jgi:hypothetical protein
LLLVLVLVVLMVLVLVLLLVVVFCAGTELSFAVHAAGTEAGSCFVVGTPNPTKTHKPRNQEPRI